MTEHAIRSAFFQAILRCGADTALGGRVFDRVASAYSGRARHYHTLDHLDDLLFQLTPYWELVSDVDAVVFAIVFHDGAYRAWSKRNEERSAQWATAGLTKLGVPSACVARCHGHILATKAHGATGNFDRDLFTDADLAILGAAAEVYDRYCLMIRREYALYPDAVYRPGRRALLEQFLRQPRLYKTEPFFDRYETAARSNIAREIESLAARA